MRKPFLSFLFFCFTAFSLCGQTFSPPVPAAVFSYHFENTDTNFHDYFLTVAFQNKISPGDSGFVAPIAMVIDPEGYLGWYMNSPAALISDLKFFPESKCFGFISYTDAKRTNYFLLDTNFMPVDSFTNSAGIISDAHEFLVLPNGNIVIGGEYDTIMDLRNETFNGKRGDDSVKVRCYVIEEFDRNHKLVFQWKSIDHIPVSGSYTYLYGYNPKAFDYCHGNAIAASPDGNLLVSFRNLNAIYKINHTNGKIIWQLGGKNSSFKFSDGKNFSGQHDVRILPNGHLSLFDNATEHPEMKATAAAEYELDTVAWIARRVWEYHYEPFFHSPSLGSYQHRADGYRLINYGFVFRPDPSLVLLGPDGKISGRVSFSDSIKSYRSYISDAGKYIRRPVIYAETLNGKIRLTAEGGHSRYCWSTGDTTASILIGKTGTYQVWVPFGAGMAGSKPVFVKAIDGTYPEGALVRDAENKLLLFILLGTALLIGAVIYSSEKKK